MINYFKFNGIVLNEIFNVVNISRVLLPAKSIQTLDIPSRDGLIFNGGKHTPIEYNVQILIQGDTDIDLYEKIGILRDLLQTKQPVEIAFSTKKYGYGMVTDQVKITPKSRLDVLVDVHITCYTPYFYAYEYKLVENKEDKNMLIFNNAGGVPTRPFISLGFTQNCDFVQLQNMVTMETILLGNYPNLELATVDENTVILTDACNGVSNWATSTVPIDGDRASGGSLAVTQDNSGLCLGGLPSNGTAQWKGVQVRRNLDSALEEFKLKAELTFVSSGVNGDPSVHPVNKESVTAGGIEYYYKVKGTSLNVRTGPSTKYAKVGTLKKGFEIFNATEVDGWIRFKYSEIGDGYYYCSKKYLTKKSRTTQVTTTKRNAAVKIATPVKSSPTSDSTTLTVIPKNGICRIISSTKYTSNDTGDIIRNWYKLAVPYNGFDGYVCAGNFYEFTDDLIQIEYDTEIDTADDKTGVLELYGMGVNNERIFKIEINDNNEYYEYTQPKIYVGLKTLYEDTTKVPPPKSYSTGDGGNIKVTNYLGGQLGSWNDFYGDITVERKKDNVGNHIWTVNLRKIKDGVVVLNKKVSQTINERATEDLAYLILYIGTHTSLDKSSDMALNSLIIEGINSNFEDDVNKVLFREGDILDIDFENRNVYLNGENRNDLVDIGSLYFNIEKGINPIKIFTNDPNLVAGGVINEKWIGAE